MDSVIVSIETVKPTALLIQPIHGRDREPVYSVFYPGPDGREVRVEVDAGTFWAIHEQAGQPVVNEPGYWAYEAQS